MKQLIYEYTEKIESRKVFANQLISGLNEALNQFKKHNFCNQPVTMEFAFALVANPVVQFDELIKINHL